MNIEFGGGLRPIKKNYKQCDVRNLPGVDFCCNAIDIGNFIASNTVDNIFSRHFFEHLSFSEGKKFLNVCFSILKPGGTVHLILPNILFHIEQWLSRESNQQFNWSKAGFWGWQRHSEDFHKSGYDKYSLEQLISQCGYVEFISLNLDSSPHLNTTFKKPL